MVLGWVMGFVNDAAAVVVVVDWMINGLFGKENELSTGKGQFEQREKG